MTAGEVPSPPPPSGGEGRYGLAPFAPAGELTFSFEVRIASGEEGAELRATQARAIKELLAWARTERAGRAGREP
ncbi:MAG: hypothetical protein ACYDH5_06745 [Acidimicrobiales bacterium]